MDVAFGEGVGKICGNAGLVVYQPRSLVAEGYAYIDGDRGGDGKMFAHS